MKGRVFASSVNAIWEADLVEMQPFAKQNGGYIYILVIIDMFSKYDWSRSYKSIPEQSPPQKLWTDKGKEFYNKSMKHKHNIDLYSTAIEEKSCGIKQNMWKYFSANNAMNYINILPIFLHACPMGPYGDISTRHHL